MAIHPTAKIHSTAIIDDDAEIGKNCIISPYVVISKNVAIHDNVVIKPHTNIEKNTVIGNGTIIESHCNIGCTPNFSTYITDTFGVIIGSNCIIYPGVGVNSGQKNNTTLGNHCTLMGLSQVGHDSIVKDNVVFSPGAIVFGGCEVNDHCVLGANSLLHQNCKIGEGAMLGANCYSSKNVLPYALVVKTPAELKSANVVGMQRRNTDKEAISHINKTYQSKLSVDEIVKQLAALNGYPEIDRIIEFYDPNSKRGYVT